jgi:hypothetical protein
VSVTYQVLPEAQIRQAQNGTSPHGTTSQRAARPTPGFYHPASLGPTSVVLTVRQPTTRPKLGLTLFTPRQNVGDYPLGVLDQMFR